MLHHDPATGLLLGPKASPSPPQASLVSLHLKSTLGAVQGGGGEDCSLGYTCIILGPSSSPSVRNTRNILETTPLCYLCSHSQESTYQESSPQKTPFKAIFPALPSKQNPRSKTRIEAKVNPGVACRGDPGHLPPKPLAYHPSSSK